MICIGIDPGKHGALVALDSDRKVVAAVRAEDYCLKNEYQPAAMARILRLIFAKMIVIERVSSWSSRNLGRTSRTALVSVGFGAGLWEGLAAMLGTPLVVVSPTVWQKEMFRGIAGEGKERAILCAESRVPSLNLKPGKCRRVHDGLADAACIALWGLQAWERKT